MIKKKKKKKITIIKYFFPLHDFPWFMLSNWSTHTHTHSKTPWYLQRKGMMCNFCAVLIFVYYFTYLFFSPPNIYSASLLFSLAMATWCLINNGKWDSLHRPLHMPCKQVDRQTDTNTITHIQLLPVANCQGNTNIGSAREELGGAIDTPGVVIFTHSLISNFQCLNMIIYYLNNE